jgi:hypothetical protein
VPTGASATSVASRSRAARTNHLRLEDEVKAVLAVPEDVQTVALMPIGYPRDQFGPLVRRPVTDVAYADRWARPWRE